MMELSFEYYKLLKEVNAEPEHLILWAAFGYPFVIVICGIFLNVLNKGALKTKIYTVFLVASFVSWLLGFIVLLVLFMFDTAGIKLLFIWSLIVCSIFFFCLIHSKTIIMLWKHFYNTKIASIVWMK